ncbi:MAG: DNA polymerase III subunit gamma/tau [Bacteroidetes bacterium]|nr:DNA polymerase III subunit gamma/tau [Bacteroidota bacterium]
MAYLVTARKWRPQLFKDVVGQEHITETLKNAIKNNRIAHAYLFTGPRGVGKTTTARIFSKALNCENPADAEPCNKCNMCLDIQNLQSMDIIEIDGASNRGIDEIRTLRESVKYAPTRGKYKIYIIDEVHMLTKESFNAFLKTLEEPPEHTIFIFATTDVHKVPLTIISRCQRFDFRRIQMDTIKGTLAKIAEAEKIKIDDKTLTIIAKKADGALRDAESYFDQIVSFCGDDIDAEIVAKMLNLIGEEVYFKISDSILNKEFKTVFEVTNIIYENGWDFIDFNNGLVEHFRNIMTVILTENTSLIETADIYKEQYLNYLGKFSKGDLLRAMNYLNKVQQELRFSQNQKLKIEIALTHLIGLEKSQTMTDLISQLNSANDEKKSLLNEPSDISYTAKSETLSLTTDNIQKTKIKKSEPSGSKLKSKEVVITITAKERNGEIDFDRIISKWGYFIDEVSGEKGLTLGPAIKSLQVQSLSGNKLNVFSDYSEIQKTIELNNKYLEIKSEAIFGKRLIFQISNQFNAKKQVVNHSIPKSKNTTNEEQKKFDDPYEQIIVNELGGIKIN